MGTERVIEPNVGVDAACGSTGDGQAAAGSRCAGLRAAGWCRLSGRFNRISSKRHHGHRLAPDEGGCAAREEVRDGFMLLPDSSCWAFRQRFERLRLGEGEAVGLP
jgi:hypothetical protein